MLSYRHAFHAGNHADVLKHLVLCRWLEYLQRKETPFLYIDTHGGAGSYALNEGYAMANREWQAGIHRLRVDAGATVPQAVSFYLRTSAAVDGYPGSPELARRLLRAQDRAVVFELHPADYDLLNAALAADHRFSVRRQDGPAALKGLLPPPSRRALTLIDPSYEVKDDYRAIPAAVEAALKRFPGGGYLVWYPLLGREDAQTLPERLLGLYGGTRCRADLRIAAPSDQERGLYGSGLVMFNPPWTLQAELAEALPWLAQRLGTAEAGWTLDWQEK